MTSNISIVTKKKSTTLSHTGLASRMADYTDQEKDWNIWNCLPCPNTGNTVMISCGCQTGRRRELQWWSIQNPRLDYPVNHVCSGTVGDTILPPCIWEAQAGGSRAGQCTSVIHAISQEAESLTSSRPARATQWNTKSKPPQKWGRQDWEKTDEKQSKTLSSWGVGMKRILGTWPKLEPVKFLCKAMYLWMPYTFLLSFL